MHPLMLVRAVSRSTCRLCAAGAVSTTGFNLSARPWKKKRGEKKGGGGGGAKASRFHQTPLAGRFRPNRCGQERDRALSLTRRCYAGVVGGDGGGWRTALLRETRGGRGRTGSCAAQLRQLRVIDAWRV